MGPVRSCCRLLVPGSRRCLMHFVGGSEVDSGREVKSGALGPTATVDLNSQCQSQPTNRKEQAISSSPCLPGSLS